MRSLVRPDVLVVGAGIVGLSCARELSSRGLKVDVIEADSPGCGASGAAAGMLSPVAEGLDDLTLGRLCCEALELWPQWAEELVDETGVDLDYDQSGTLLPEHKEDRNFLDEIAEVARKLGLVAESLEETSLQKEIPQLAPEIERALFLPAEHRVDPQQVIKALCTSLRQRGVRIHTSRPVQSIVVEPESVRLNGLGWSAFAPEVLCAAGAWSSLIPSLKHFNVRPIRGQMVSYEDIDWPWQTTIRTRSFYAVRRRDQRLLIGATVEEEGFDASVTDVGRQQLAEFAHSLFPRLRWRATSGHWAGLRPSSPDSLPLVGRVGQLPLMLATGHYRSGILLAPWTALAMADDMVGQGSIPKMLSPQRFMTSA